MPSEVSQPRSRRWRVFAALAAVVALVAVSPLLFGLRDGGSGSDGVGEAANDGCGTGASGAVVKVEAAVERGGTTATAWVAPQTGDFRLEQGDAPIVRCGGASAPLLVQAVRAWEDGRRQVDDAGTPFTVGPAGEGWPPGTLLVEQGGGRLYVRVVDRIPAGDARRRGLFTGGDQG